MSVQSEINRINTAVTGQAGLISQIQSALCGLPNGYTHVEYIQSSGTQYINLGISVPHASEKIIVVFSPVDESTDNVITGHAAPSWSWATNLSFVLDRRIWVANTGIGGVEIVPNTFHTFEYTTATASVNGVSKVLNAGSYTDGYNNTLFYSSTKYGKHKVKSYKLYNGSTLVRDLVPCLNASGKAGMYDTVNGVFYGNAGTGEFEIPPESTLPQTEQNTEDLQEILETVNAMPEPVDPAPVLLWTNASPTSQFSGQGVSVAGGYIGYLIECRYDNMTDIRTIVYVPNGVKTRITVPSATSDYYDRGAARFATGANGKVTFTGGRITGYTSDNNYFAIPTRIWGVKFTL